MKFAKGDTKFVKAFGKTQFVPFLEKAINGWDGEWSYDYSPKKEDDGWHPSSHCTPTIHELWQVATGVAVDPFANSGMNKTFQVGHFWHQYLQHITLNVMEFCDESAIERRGEVRWGDGPFQYATGAGDIAPVTLPDGKELLVDFKTMASHTFRANDPPAYAIDKWECQTAIYMDFFDLEEAIIVGINKDSPHNMKEFRYFRNPELVEVIYGKWKLVSECVKEDIEPPEDVEIELPLKGAVK
jgi:hypothetical protein